MEPRSTKLTIGAVLCIVGGIMGILWTVIGIATEWDALGDLNAVLWLIMSIALGLVAIQGGRYALKRQRFWWAIIGSLCATLSSLLLGIPALILLVLSRKEFR